MNIKEIIENTKNKIKTINAKNVAIIVVILAAIFAGTLYGYEYYQNKQQEKLFEERQETAFEEEEEAISLMYQNEEKQNLKPSEYKIGIPYEKAIKGNKPIVVLFFADWCRYCIKFMPKYKTIANIYKDELEFSKINVEDKQYEKVVKDAGIMGFPTVYIIDPKYDNKVLLPAIYYSDVKKLRTELERYIRIRKLLDSKK